MNRSCIHEINECLPCNDSPVENLSAESLDLPTILGIATIPRDPPLGEPFSKLGCIGWCFSTISQADADECAAAQDPECPPPGTPDPPDCPDCDVYQCVGDPSGDCESFDCAGSVAKGPYDPYPAATYSLRPRVDFGYQIPTGWNPSGYMDQVVYLTSPSGTFRYYFEDDSLLRFQGYSAPGEAYGMWVSSLISPTNPPVFLIKIGARWELNVYNEVANINVPSFWKCLTNSGPPSFTCLTAGCFSGLGLDYITNDTVYTAASQILFQAWQDIGWSITNGQSCPEAASGFQRDCIGACALVDNTDYCVDMNHVTTYGWEWSGQVRGCRGYKVAPSAPYVIPCNLETRVYNLGAGHTVQQRTFEHAIKMECFDDSSPSGTYTPAGGHVRETACGYTKGIYRPLAASPVVTLEVPPP